MGKVYESITPELAKWIDRQKLFFVATAPLAGDGLVNCSPKGMDSFRILGPREVAYLDLTGSGIETTAHLRENGRMVLMFCAFDGPPKIVRLHGTGETLTPEHPEFAFLIGQFPAYRGTRSIIRAKLSRISDSCGYSIPKFDYVGERDTLEKWCESRTDEELVEYRQKKNTLSLDGLPGLV
jgi:Pyridoxamine 5'-phosphate oxidase